VQDRRSQIRSQNRTPSAADPLSSLLLVPSHTCIPCCRPLQEQCRAGVRRRGRRSAGGSRKSCPAGLPPSGQRIALARRGTVRSSAGLEPCRSPEGDQRECLSRTPHRSASPAGCIESCGWSPRQAAHDGRVQPGTGLAAQPVHPGQREQRRHLPHGGERQVGIQGRVLSAVRPFAATTGLGCPQCADLAGASASHTVADIQGKPAR